MMDLEALTTRFAAVEGVRFAAAADLGYGVDATRGCVVVENAYGRVVVALNGAHLLSWVPAGKPDVLWLSPLSQMADGKPIRGGIPLCAPWFGPGKDDLPLHGWARISDWEVEAITSAHDGVTTLVLALAARDDSGLGYAIDHDMRFEIVLGASLTLRFAATNRATEAKPFEIAFHTYFAVGDVDAVTVTGLEGCTVLDRMSGTEDVQGGPVHIDFPLNRIYLDPPETQELKSPNGTCRIASGARAAVIWNPGEGAATVPDLGPGTHRAFVCVERLDAAARAVTLEPGASHAVEMTLTAF